MKKTLQEFADEVLAPEFRQELKSSEEVVELQGWGSPAEPICCGKPVPTKSFLGCPYHAECETCGKFAHAMDGPSFSESGSSCTFLDGEKVELATNGVWIIGVRPVEAAAGLKETEA